MGKSDINNLGQYFTIDSVARFMNSFIEDEIASGDSVLDPCIGKNVFFRVLKNNNYALTGLEIDKGLIDQDIRKFYKRNSSKLIIDDFVTHKFLNKFDAIVMNPPYTRQEKISLERKKELLDISNSLGANISRKANLYIFFILKALSLLKRGGIFVAITYDSWLYSSFGEVFRKYLVDNYNLQRIVHFKSNAFLNVDIGATIMVIKNEEKRDYISYLAIQNPEELNIAKNEASYAKLSYSDLIKFNDHLTTSEKIHFDDKYFRKIADCSEKIPWRGAESPINKHFVFKTKFMDGLSRVIKYGSLETYYVADQDSAFALSAPKYITDVKIQQYLQNIKQDILTDENATTIKSKILSKPYWYKFLLQDGGNIIFNYYFRDNIKFLFNKNRIPTMGNFYNLEIKQNTYLLFAILNSSLTGYAFKRFSKSQGRGLRKIQLKQFNDVPIFKIEYFTKKEIATLNHLGKQLSLVSGKADRVVNDINAVVLSRYSKISGQSLKLLTRIISSAK